MLVAPVEISRKTYTTSKPEVYSTPFYNKTEPGAQVPEKQDVPKDTQHNLLKLQGIIQTK